MTPPKIGSRIRLMDAHPLSGACGEVVRHLPLDGTVVSRVKLDDGAGEFDGMLTLVRDGQWELEDEGRDQS